MKLGTWIKQNSTVTEFGRRIGRTRQQVYRYIRGENLTKRIVDGIVDETGGAVTADEAWAGDDVKPDQSTEVLATT